MGLNFRKSVTICKGVRVNLGKKSASISVGTKGLRYTMSTTGRKSATVGLPGTGLSYTHTFGKSSKKKQTEEKTVKTSEKKQAVKASDKKRAADSKKEKSEQEMALQQEAQAEASEYEQYVASITRLYTECGEEINWQAIGSEISLADGEPGIREKEALKAYESYEPTLYERAFGDGGEKKKMELLDAIESARQADKEEYENQKAIRAFARDILDGDIDAYLEVIARDNPFENLVEYGCNFEFGTDDPRVMEVEFQAQIGKVVPVEGISLTKTGKVSKNMLTKTAYYSIAQDYVCSCAIRIAREMFALLPVELVLVHVTDIAVNTANGCEEEYTILSVQFDRADFTKIRFDYIDASDCVESFPHRMKFVKTGGFKAVERVMAGSSKMQE